MSSVKEALVNDLNELAQKNVTELFSIMERMGVDNGTMSQWIQVMKDQVSEVYSSIIEDATSLQDKLIDNIEELLKKSEELCKQLRIKMPSYGSQHLSLGEEKAFLKGKVAEYDALIQERLSEINKLKKRQKDACNSLGIEEMVIPDSPLPTIEEMDNFASHVDALEMERFKRETKFIEVKYQILEIIRELGIQPSLEIEKTLCSPDDSLFLVTDHNMNWLSEYYDSLVQQKAQTANEIFQLREKVRSLWEKLEEDIKSSNEFLQKHTGNSLATLTALQQEVKRCELLKKANIEKFIKTMRDELMLLWDKCHFATPEREKFEFLHDTIYTEDLLMFHEIEIEKMKKYYEENKAVLSMLERRDEYWKRKTELDHRATDPNRYKNRGGTLLKEEKERNGLTKKLREMELELLEFASRYENEHNKPFRSWGETIPDIIERTREDYENLKKQHLSVKKQQRNMTPTPVKSGFLGSTFSGSKRNLLTLTPGPATPGTSSCKRKLQPTQIFSSNKKRTPLTEVPKVKINDRTLMEQTKGIKTAERKRIRYSHERKKRMEQTRRLSKMLSQKKNSNDSMDYNTFEKEMCEKAACRSTIFEGCHSSVLAQPLPSTPKGSRTPSKCGTLTRTPTYTKLKTIPGSNMHI